jgi:hypothetical protein
MKPIAASAIAVVMSLGVSVAVADVKVTSSPPSAIPGSAVLVTVTGSKEMPEGKAGKHKLHFFAARGGHQAVVAIPLDHQPGPFEIAIDGAAVPSVVTVREHTFPEAAIVVEDELANPDAAHRDQIDADNHAMRTALAGATGAPQFTRKFAMPGKGKVTSKFGEWRTFNDGHRSQHLGLDLGARKGSVVKAVAAGTVALVRETFLAGNVVVLDHGGGIASAYFHLAEISVKEGDRVKAGGRVGTVGQTGRTTGPHLHLSVWAGGDFVDPASFLRLDLRPAAKRP